jgi:hypothetical protein
MDTRKYVFAKTERFFTKQVRVAATAGLNLCWKSECSELRFLAGFFFPPRKKNK